MRRTIALLLLAAACGGGDDPAVQPRATAPPTTEPPAVTETPGAPADPEIKAADNAFSPRSLTVAAGTKVVVRSTGSNPHTWTHKPDFDVALDERGADGSYVFTRKGTYEYACSVHAAQGMTGVVVVT